MNTSKAAPKNKTLLGWLLIIALSLVWGSSYILIKKGLIAYNPVQLASLRISISGLAFLPFFILNYKSIDWSKTKYYAIVGLTGNFFPAFLFALAQTEINSSVAGVLSSLTPLFTLLLGLLFYANTFSWYKTLAVLIGLFGASILILFGKEAGLQGNNLYALLVVLGALLYSISANTVKKHLQEIDPIALSTASFMIIFPPALIYLFTTDFLTILNTSPSGYTSLGYIVLLAIAGTVIASILFYKLVQLTNAIFATMVSYLIPIVAIGWGYIDGESITLYHLIGMSFILLGVYISRK